MSEINKNDFANLKKEVARLAGRLATSERRQMNLEGELKKAENKIKRLQDSVAELKRKDMKIG